MSTELPAGYRAVLGGASVAFQESMSSLLFALVLGIIFAYMVLASQFNSFSDPATVLTILPLSLTGAAAALMIAGKSLNIFSMIGLLLLLGIVKKNSIILVDYANQGRALGLSPADAMLRRGTDPPAADPDDERRHIHGGDSAGAGPRRGFGNPHAHGDRGDRRPDRVHRPEFDGRAVLLCKTRRMAGKTQTRTAEATRSGNRRIARRANASGGLSETGGRRFSYPGVSPVYWALTLTR